MLINATLREKYPPISLPKIEYMERGLELWNELGLPPVKPQNPWHGYSLGEWWDELDDEAKLALLSAGMQFGFGSTLDGEESVWLGGEEVTAAIRTEAAGNDASKVAALPAVRAALLDRQRRFAVAPGLVADGRDMGTVVCPAARVKIFLTASADERAARRYKQLKEKGVAATLAALSKEIAERDERDTTRTISPLVASEDAVLLDTTGMSIDAVVERVLSVARERLSI